MHRQQRHPSPHCAPHIGRKRNTGRPLRPRELRQVHEHALALLQEVDVSREPQAELELCLHLAHQGRRSRVVLAAIDMEGVAGSRWS
eukprot:2014111-Prymnesium_polylepis.1